MLEEIRRKENDPVRRPLNWQRGKTVERNEDQESGRQQKRQRKLLLKRRANQMEKGT
jgi:hypothetical protein